MPFFSYYSDPTIQLYTLCTRYGRYTTICTVQACMCSFPSFFGVRIPSLTAVSYAIWFGDPRLRKRELPSSLCPFFFNSLRWDDNRHTHTLYQYLSIYCWCCQPNPGSKQNRLRIISGEIPYCNVRVNGGVVCQIYYCVHASFQSVVVHNI